MADVKISGLPNATTPVAGTEVLPIVQGGVTKQVSVDNLTAGKAVSATQYTSTVATGTAPLVVSSTTEVANLRAANATSADTANQVKSNATTGVLQVTGPTAASTRVMTTPDANFTVARTDAANSFTADQTLATGNLVIGTSGKGIDFSVTGEGTGTMTSELFDDYEVGTFSPTMSSASGVTTLVSSEGQYTKVGNVVVAQFRCTITTDASVGTSNFTIGNLPFTSNSARSSRGFVVSSNATSSDLNDGGILLSTSATSMTWNNRTVNASNRTNNALSFIITYRT